MTPHAALRSGTREAHERVDAAFSRFDLTNRDDYADFLAAMAAAFLPAEAALEAGGIADRLGDWPDRRRSALLFADLAELGGTPGPPVTAPAADDEAAQAGLLYVLEGSRLGGAVLRRSLGRDFPRRFLAAPQPAGGWRNTLDILDEWLYCPALVERAVAIACAGFAAFEAAAAAQWEKRARCLR